jgi:hypothetical protein
LPLGGPPGDGGPPNRPIGANHADVWSDWFDAALAGADSAATWGLVMPLPAMGDGTGASPGFITAFRVILDEITAAMSRGEAVSLTAARLG